MIEEILKMLSVLGSGIPTGERVSETFKYIIGGTDAMNQRFVQSKQRVSEFSAAIGDSIPLVARLGGGARDAVEIIDKVAMATRRNVVASAEEVSKLYAAQKLTGTDAQTLVDKFQNVGVGYSQIGGQLENSIKYIQSVGGNARDIMQQVSGIVENINKYNFQDGVLGLTRMATQAQLLKFDMNQTLNMAEKALNPEGAIEMASAFQRMGVSVADLTDPFQLMYKSLNDPEGLQNSLIQMTKQFTYFDEKANTFKINPQGMLMLRELGPQIGVTSAELSKMALNAADLDAKLSQISPSFEFENEEDKQYIANIAKMGKGGEYEITIKDDKGLNKTIPLQEASNDQLKELVERQKNAQEDKSLEQLQKDQLDVLSLIKGEIVATRASYEAGVASSTKLTEAISGMGLRTAAIEGIVNFIKENNLDKTPAQIRSKVDDKFEPTVEFLKNFIKNNGENVIKVSKEVLADMKRIFESSDIGGKITEKISEVIDGLKSTGIIPNLTPNDEGRGAFIQPKLTNISSNSIIAERLEIRNANDFVASAVTNKTITEQISSLSSTTAKTEIKETKVNFGSIPPLEIVFKKGGDFSEKDMAMLEYNLTNNKIGEMLTEKISQNLKLLQTKDA